MTTLTDLGDGVRRWTSFHEEWKEEVGCVAIERDPARLVLIDPLLDDDIRPEIETLGENRGVEVLLTIHYHSRSAAEIAGLFPGTRVWGPSRDAAALRRRVPLTDVFREGDELPGGLRAFSGRPRTEALFWDEASRSLIAGDVLVGTDEGGISLCPGSWLPSSTGLGDLREALRPLLELPIERVVVSHGEPVTDGGKAALESALVE